MIENLDREPLDMSNSRHDDFDVVVVGSVNWQYLVRGSELPRRGETVQGTEMREGPGGKAGNQAVAAARLGARTALVARIGPDAMGTEFLRRLRSEGVDTSYVARDAVVATGVSLAMVSGGGETRVLTVPGANQCLSAPDVERATTIIRNAGVLLVQLDAPTSTVARAVDLGGSKECIVVLDAVAGQRCDESLLCRADVVLVDAIEAQAWSGVVVQDERSARQAARELMRRGARGLVIHTGSHGDLVATRGDCRWLPHVPLPAVDTTGASDAYAAALAVMLADGASLMDAADFAQAASALASTVVGAQAGLPHRDTVQALLATESAWSSH